MAAFMFDMISKPEFISTINSAVQSQAPNSIELNGVKGESRDSKKIEMWVTHCWLDYKVEGELEQCNGLKSVELLRLVDTSRDAVTKNANGDIEVSLSPSLRVGGISCNGWGRASGSSCEIRVSASADASAKASVSQIGATLRGRMEQGTGANQGKMCLKVLSIDGDVQQSAVSWSDFRMKWSGLNIHIPDSVINGAFRAMPLEKPINNMVDELTGTLMTELDKMSICV